MRAIAGAVVSSETCSLANAIGILARFAYDASDLLSSDAATYLRTAIEAANDLHIFRRDLGRYQQQQGGDVEAAHEGVEREGGENEKKHRRSRDQDREMKAEGEKNGVMFLAAGPQGSSGEKKSKKKRKKGTEEDEEDAAPHGGLHSPASEKRRKKKERHVKEEDQSGNVDEKANRQTFDDGLQNLLLEDGIDKGKSGKKKKHMKQKKEVSSAKEVEQTMVRVGVASEKKKGKKMAHTKEEEEKKDLIIDGDLGSDKKRKKKRGRADDNGNDKALVEHTNKKQQK